MQYRSMQMLKVPHVDTKLHPSNSKTIPFLIAVAEKTVDRFRWCRLCMFVQLFIVFWKKHNKYTYLRDGYGLRNVAHHLTGTCACLVYGENECMCCMFCPMSTFFITLEKCNSDWWCAQRRTFLFLCFFGIKHLFGQIPLLWPQRNQRLAPLGGIPTVQMYLSPQMRET